MKLLYSLKPSNQKFKQISNIKELIEPVMFEVLHKLNISIVRSKQLSKVDIYNHISNKNPQYLEKNMEKELQYLEKTLKPQTIRDYYKFFTRFTPIPILQSIMKKYSINHQFKFTYDTNTIIFNTYVYKKCNYSDIFIKSVKVLSFLKYINIQNRTIYIHYANTPFKKKFPKYVILGPHSVNSGVTTHYMNMASITIYREEESDKVLLHELVHYLRLDFAMNENINTIMNNIIIKQTNINPNPAYINLFEAYTDSIAIIFNSIFNSILTNTDVSDYFYTELIYIQQKAIQILHHFNIHSIEELYNKSSLNLLYQSTSVLSYYILKFGLLYDTDRLLTDFFPLFLNNWTKKKVMDLYDMIILNIIKINSNDTIKEFNTSSLRMSFNELNIED